MKTPAPYVSIENGHVCIWTAGAMYPVFELDAIAASDLADAILYALDDLRAGRGWMP